MPYREPPTAPPEPDKPHQYWHWALLTDGQEAVGFWLWMLYLLVGGTGIPYLFLRLGAVARGFMPWWMLLYYGVFAVFAFLFPTLYWMALGLRKRDYP